MDSKQLKKAEKRVNLLYALYDAEEGAEEKAYIRRQITTACLQLYGTEDSPDRKKVVISKESEPKISIHELVDYLNQGMGTNEIANKVGMKASTITRLKKLYTKATYEVVMPSRVNKSKYVKEVE